MPLFKFALFLAAMQPAIAQRQLMPNGGAGSSEDSDDSAKLPLNPNFIRSIEGTEDPRAGNHAELLRLAGPARYPDGQGLDTSMITEPSARGISNLVADPDTLTSPPGKSRASDMLWQWGQFMDHDIGLTEGHDEDVPITSPNCTTDIICTIPFQRAIHTFINGVREQINEITGFLDASMVYGHTNERAAALRDTSGGRLLMAMDGLMPGVPADYAAFAEANGEPINANPGFPDENFFFGGDIRVNEQIGLIAIHTLWVREHNRVAGLLEAEFPTATDEELYQMTRKIITAEIQAITYKEFLPILIGSYAPDLDAYNGFDATVNPGVATEFSTVAFRVGHTFLSGDLLLHDGQTSAGSIPLRNVFFDPALFTNNTIDLDKVLIGQTIQAANAADTKIVSAVRDFLFGNPVGGVGLDLVSLNIQRGRDNGVLGYNGMRAGYGLSPFSTFLQVTGGDTVIAAELEEAYPGGVEQCDAWICGLAEPAVGGGELGELFATIIAEQYQRSMDGDRFFYLADRQVDHPLIRNVINVHNRTLTDVINDNTVGTTSGFAMLVNKTATTI